MNDTFVKNEWNARIRDIMESLRANRPLEAYDRLKDLNTWLDNHIVYAVKKEKKK